MPTCTSCGGNFDDTFQFCPYCGKPKPKPQETIKVDVVSHEPYSLLDCPKCHRIDSVSRVSAIVQGGTHQINGQIPVSYTSHDSEGWHSGTSYENYHATQQSTLAMKLMPPEKPKKNYGGLIGLAFMSVLIFLCACFFVFSVVWSTGDNKPLLGLGIGIGTIIMYGVFLLGVWRAGVSIDKPLKAKHAANLAAWERSLSKWRELYYCSRDDCIFIPGEGFGFNVSDLNEAIK